MIPTLHFSGGEMMPGQFGPMRRDGVRPAATARAFDFRKKS